MSVKNVTGHGQSLIERLRLDLSAGDVEDGWTRESADAIARSLQQVLSASVFERKRQAVHLARYMDYWGIVEGKLFEEICSLQNDISGQ